MTLFAESVRTVIVDADTREVNLMLRAFPSVTVRAFNLRFEGDKFYFSALCYGAESDKDSCNAAMEFMRQNDLAVGNYIRQVALPVLVGLEPEFKNMLKADLRDATPAEAKV